MANDTSHYHAMLRVGLCALGLLGVGCKESKESLPPGVDYYIRVEDTEHRPIPDANVLVECTYRAPGGLGEGLDPMMAEGETHNYAWNCLLDKEGTTHFRHIGGDALITITRDGYRELRLGIHPGDHHPSPDSPRVFVLTHVSARDVPAMLIAVDEEKKTATILPDPLNAPEKTVEMPLLDLPKEMRDFYAKPVWDETSALADALYERMQKHPEFAGAFIIIGKVTHRLRDGTLLVDCPRLPRNPGGWPNIRLEPLASTKLVEGNVVLTTAVRDRSAPSQDDDGLAPPYPHPMLYKELGLPPVR